jgi:hypothetical protein
LCGTVESGDAIAAPVPSTAAPLASTEKRPAKIECRIVPRSLTAAEVLLERDFNLLASSDV